MSETLPWDVSYLTDDSSVFHRLNSKCLTEANIMPKARRKEMPTIAGISKS